MRKVWVLAASAALVAASQIVAVTPAEARINPSVIRTITNLGVGERYCLDGHFTDEVLMWECNGARSQQWKLYRKEVPGPNPLKLRNMETDQCLDIRFEHYFWRPYTHSCNDGDYQRWNDYPANNLKQAERPTKMPNRKHPEECMRGTAGRQPFYMNPTEWGGCSLSSSDMWWVSHRV